MSVENSNIFSITSSAAKISSGSWGGFNTNGLIPLRYNGVDVYYVPKSFVEKGYTTGTAQYLYPSGGGYVPSGGDATWFANLAFLDEQLYPFIKPASLSQDFVDLYGENTTKPFSFQHEGRTYTYTFDMRNVPDFQNGYIIEKAAFDQAANRAGTNYAGVPGAAISYNPARVPGGMGMSPDGKLSYVGYTQGGGGYDQRFDLFYVNNSQPWGYYQFEWYNQGKKSLFQKVFGSSLGGFLDMGLRIVSPWYNLGRAIGDVAFNDGKIGDVALALVGVNTPNASGVSAAKGTIFEIPQIASATSKIADFYTTLGLSPAQAAAAAKVTFDTGLGYLANGQDLNKAFTNAAAGFAGNMAGGEVAKLVSGLGPDLQKITAATTSAATKATLLNQDVGQAVNRAFIETSVPIAVDGALKAAGATVPASVRTALINTATQAALNPDADIEKILAGAVTGALVDVAFNKTKEELIKAGIVESGDSKALERLKNIVEGVVAGRDPSQVITSELVKAAAEASANQLKDWSAQQQGWDNWAAKENAQKLYGKDVTPALAAASSQAILEAIVNNPNVDERALQEYINTGYLTKDFVEKATNKSFDDVMSTLNARVTTEEEANRFFQEKFGREPQSEQDIRLIEQLVGKPEIATRATFETVNLRQQDYNSVVFDASGFDDPNKAAEAAKEAGFNRFAMDGQEFVVNTPVAEAGSRSAIESAKTFGEAFALARKELGAGKVFEWNGQKYSTNIASEQSAIDAFKNAYDGSSAGSFEGAAISAYLANKGSFIGPDGKVYLLNDENKQAIENYMASADLAERRKIQDAIRFVDPELLKDAAKYREPPSTLGGEIVQSFKNYLGAVNLGTAEIARWINSAADALTTEIGEDGQVKKFFNDGTVFKKVADTFEKEGNALMDPRFFQIYDETMERVSKAGSIGEGTMILANAALENPWIAPLVIVKEMTTEAPALLTGVAAYRALGMGAAALANGGLQALEVGGNSYQEVRDGVLKNGGTEAEAHMKGMSAFGATMAISAATAGVADAMLIKQIAKGISVDSVKPFVTNTALQYYAEGMQGGLEALYNHHEITGQWSQQAFNAGFAVESVIGAATTAGILSTDALVGSAVVATTRDNKPITLDQLRTGSYNGELDIGSLDTAAVVGKSGNGSDISLGGLFTAPLISGVEYGASQAFVPDILTNQNITVGYDALGDAITLGDIMGQVTPSRPIDQVFQSTVNQDAKAREEAQASFIEQALRDAGYTTYTADDIEALLNTNNPGGSEAIIAKAQEYADPLVTTADEAIQMLLAAGYTDPTEEEIAQFVGSIPEQAAQAQVSEYVAPRMVTEADARAFFDALGYVPNEQELAQFVRQGSDVQKAQVEQELADYVNPRQVTEAEARAIFSEIGYDPSDEEVRQFVKQGPEVQQDIVRQLLEEYVDPRFVSEAEARAAYEALGLRRPTEEDIRALMGQYDQTLLGGKAESSLDRARYNSIMAEIDRLAGSTGADPSVIDAIKNDLNAQIEALGGDLDALRGSIADRIAESQNQTQTQIGEVESRLQQAIADAEAAGLTRDQAIQAGLEQVSTELGTTREGLLQQLGTTEAALRGELQAGLEGVSAEVKAAYDALSAEQKALADDLAAQGVSLSDAIATAQSALESQIGGVQQEVRDQYAALTAEQKVLADALAAQGVSLSDAIAEAQRQTQEQIGGVQADVQAKFDALTAEQKTLAESLTQQGVDLRDAIDLAATQGREALTETEQRLASQVQQVADLLGKPARQVTQADIDYVNQMIGGQQADLAYDANQDGRIDQADVDFLTRIMAGNVDEPWAPAAGTTWAPTGLFAQQAAEAERTRQRLTEERERDRQEQERQAQAARRLELRGQARQSLQGIAQQLPQFAEQSTRRIDPIYAQTRYHSFQAPLFQTNLWGEQPVQTPTNQPNQFRMASGGYLDLQGEPQTWDDIYRMLK